MTRRRKTGVQEGARYARIPRGYCKLVLQRRTGNVSFSSKYRETRRKTGRNGENSVAIDFPSVVNVYAQPDLRPFSQRCSRDYSIIDRFSKYIVADLFLADNIR